MANLILNPIWETVIYELATSDPVLGGANGLSNIHGKQIGNRTEYLKAKLDGAGITDAVEYSGDLVTLKVPGAYLILTGASNKPSSGNGVCFVVARASVASGANHYTHFYVDAVGDFYTRVYINNSAVGGWVAFLKKSVYDAQQLAEVGKLSLFHGSAAKQGWLLALGQDVSRTTYANLYAVIGTQYGVGNGTTTFGLPDFENIPATPGNSGSFSYYIKY